MFVQVCSDLHGYLPQISPAADLVIFAGDVATTPSKVLDMFTNVRKTSKAIIIYVLGNHEYYDNIYPDSIASYRHSIKDLPGVFLLENEEALANDISILGCTLWTDYDNQRCIAQAVFGLNDFELISAVEGNKFRKVVPGDFLKAHYESKKWLEKKLKFNKENGIKTIVVTHHVPSFSLISSRFKGDPLNGAFASSCDDLIMKYEPSLWVFGHTHAFKDTMIGNTHCVCNQVGYRGETTHYKQKYLVEI